MSRIKGKDTKPEMLVRKFLFKKGLRYRKNVNSLPGRPDIVLSKYKTVIFVHGCFWHAHTQCKRFVWPSSNLEYWQKKISGNVKRDEENRIKLNMLGWKVITIWECELKKEIVNITLDGLYKEIVQEKQNFQE